MSLRTKLTLTHILVSLLAVAAIALILNRAVTVAFRQFANDRAKIAAQTLVQPLAEIYAQRGGWGDLGRGLGSRPGPLLRLIGQRVVVADATGTVVYDTQNKIVGQAIPNGIAGISAPIKANGAQVGSVAVAPAVGQLGDLEDRFLTAINRLLLVTSLVTGGVAALLGLGLALGLTRPLRALTDAAGQFANNRQVPQLPVSSDDEVGRLTVAFNQMSAEIAHQETLRRRMVADIAHELRTPLSVLRLELEAIEDGVTQPNTVGLASLHEEVALLNRLVDDLRLLSLTEAGQLELHLSATDPQAVVERAASLAQARARQRGIGLAVELPQRLRPVQADEDRLVQVIGNLVENAIRYTPAGGSIALRAAEGGSGVVFSVADTGPGIAAVDLERVFERFYRTDAARARETGGSGLGLAIVRNLVLAMGGQVWAESQPGHGATFCVRLPS